LNYYGSIIFIHILEPQSKIFQWKDTLYITYDQLSINRFSLYYFFNTPQRLA